MERNYKDLGRKGEQLVATYLEKDGFVIRALNYSRKCGEIDIIAQRKELVVFVEVKLRQTRYFNISEVISYPKRRKIITTARFYSAESELNQHILRFDVALVEPQGNDYAVTYIPNAFTEEHRL